MSFYAKCTKLLAIVLAAVALTAVPAPSRAEVPAEAQPAFNKGVLAARQQEWDIALQSFQDARKIAPTSPEIYYNLGLTESKIPGRELRAIAWLAAYLAADPQAPNASVVKTAIQGLLVKNEGNNDRFIEITRKAAEQVPPGELGVGKEVALAEVFRLYAEEGNEDKAAAFASEEHLSEVDLTSNSALYSMTDFGGREGIQQARLLAPSQEPIVRGWIAMGEAKIGDIAGALKDISAMPDGKSSDNGSKPLALIAVARTQFKLGLKQASWATLQEARNAAQKMDNRYGDDYFSICDAQVNVGDIAGARTTADLDHGTGRENCLKEIAIAQLASGDVQGAQSTANHIDDKATRVRLQDQLDEFNKDPSTRKTLEADQASLTRDWVSDADGSAMFRFRRLDGSAPSWIAELDDANLSRPMFLDLSAYVASITGPGVYQPERLLYQTARGLLYERRCVTGMLAKEFGPGFVQ